jgi:HlyD family secretion protein
MLRILVVNEQSTVRSGIKDALKSQPDFELVGTASDSVTALEQTELLQPDLVVIDQEMSCFNGISAAQMIRQQFPCIQVLRYSNQGAQDILDGTDGVTTQSIFHNDGSIQRLQKLIGQVSPGHKLPVKSPESAPEYQGLGSKDNVPQNAWSATLQTVLDQPPATFPRLLLVSGLIFILTAGVWSWYGHLEQIGRAEGQLIPKGKVFKVNSTNLGKVSVIAVKEGQSVYRGQILLELEHDLEANDIQRLKENLAASELELRQKLALVAQQQQALKVQEEIAQMQIQTQKAALIEPQQQAATIQALISQVTTDINRHQERLKRLENLLGAGAISKDQLFAAEQLLHERQQNLTHYEGQLKQFLAQEGKLKTELGRSHAESRSVYLQGEKQLQQLKIEINQLRATITETQNLIESAQTQRNQRYLRAPVDGVVSFLNVNNIGEVIESGQTVLEISPKGRPLVLSAALPSREAGLVTPGMPVNLKFYAYPYQDYGIIPGELISISPDAKENPKLGTIYQIEVGLKQNYIKNGHQIVYFKPGQTASAEIIIRRRRLIEILLDPIRKISASVAK